MTISNKLIEVIQEEGASVLETWVSETKKTGRAVLSIDGAVSNWHFCNERNHWTRSGY